MAINNQNLIPEAEFRKGDNSKAFNNDFLQIDLEIDENEPMPSKVEFITGCIIKPFTNPQFPIYVNFDESESLKLNNINIGYLIAYDEFGQRLTCIGSIKFTIKNGVICQC